MKTDESHLLCGMHVELEEITYTYLVDGEDVDTEKLDDYYIVKLRDGTYRIFKKVKTDREKDILRMWGCESREYINLSWIPKGWGPCADDMRRIASGGEDRVVSGKVGGMDVVEGSILYALPNDFGNLSDAEENLKMVVSLLARMGMK